MDLEICNVKLGYDHLINAMAKPMFGDEEVLKALINQLSNEEVLDYNFPEQHSKVFVKAYVEFLKADNNMMEA